jgi:hypothetical protein
MQKITQLLSITAITAHVVAATASCLGKQTANARNLFQQIINPL